MKVYCEARIGICSGDVKDLARQYSEKFIKIPFGLSNVEKLGMLEQVDGKNYFLLISKSDMPMPAYNIIISVMGPDHEKSKAILDNIQKKINIKTREAPFFVKKQFDAIQKFMETLFEEPTYH